MDKLHFASAEAYSLSKKTEYRRQVIEREERLTITGKSPVRLSDPNNKKSYIIHYVLRGINRNDR